MASTTTRNNEPSEAEIIKKYMPSGFMLDGNIYMPICRPETIRGAMNFRFRPSDILISSYPKSGTTWTCEIVSWLVNANNDEVCKTRDLHERVAYLETLNYQTWASYIEQLEKMPETEQRIIKTHIPPHMFHSSIWETKPKIIHAYRNPLDALVSYYNFYKSVPLLEYNDTWEEFFEMYKKGYVCYGDYCEHLKEWCEHKDDSNVLVIEYESMQLDLKREIRRIAEFLALKDMVISDELIEKVAQKCSFGNMKNNPLIYAPLVRKGIVGDWKNYFNDEQKEFILKDFEAKITPYGIKARYE